MGRPLPVPRDARSLAALAVPPPPDLTLREILDEAVSWQEEAEAVITLCVPGGGKTQVLARRGALVATAYRVLRDAALALPASPARDELEQLLNFHRQLLEQALFLGFRPDSPERERVAAHCRGGLAGPGMRLRVLRRRVCARPGSES